MKKVYFLRHGLTNYNQKGLVQDGSDTLTDEGIKQAYRVAERVQHLDFTHLLVSDYERAKQTAAPISELTGVTAEFSPLFREVRRPSSFYHTPKDGEEYKAFIVNAVEHYADKDWHHSDEENFYDVLSRAREAVALLERLDGDIVVVSHGMYIRFIAMYMLFQEQFSPELWRTVQYNLLTSNTGITTFKYNQSWQLLTFNDHAHFAE